VELRHLETIFRWDQVIVTVLVQIDLHPVNLAAELIVLDGPGAR
jgi:hypothetical protein